MLRLCWRPAFFVLIFIVLASCSGAGGCSGCAGCGITPLPAGFPQASVIPNAASVRVTRPGLDFISANIGTVAGDALGTTGGVITFNVPASSSNLTIATALICQSPNTTQCVADINIGGAKLHVDSIASANGPNMEPAIEITGTIPVKIADIPVGVQVFGATLCTIDVEVGSGACGSVDYAPVPVTAILPIIAVPSVIGMMIGARIGAHLLTILKASVIRRLVIGILLFAGLRTLLKGLGIWI